MIFHEDKMITTALRSHSNNIVPGRNEYYGTFRLPELIFLVRFVFFDDGIKNAVVMGLGDGSYDGIAECRRELTGLGERYISTSTLLVPPNIFLFPPVKANPP